MLDRSQELKEHLKQASQYLIGLRIITENETHATKQCKNLHEMGFPFPSGTERIFFMINHMQMLQLKRHKKEVSPAEDRRKGSQELQHGLQEERGRELGLVILDKRWLQAKRQEQFQYRKHTTVKLLQGRLPLDTVEQRQTKKKTKSIMSKHLQ